MIKNYAFYIPAILILATVSSCSLTKLDISYEEEEDQYQHTNVSGKTMYETDPDYAVRKVYPTRIWRCPANPPKILYPEPIFQIIVKQSQSNSITLNSWSANSRKQANNKSPHKDGTTLIQTKEPGRK